MGRTVDDAAGEAFDKVAKLLGLGYPGGPWIDSLAKFGNPHAVPFSFAQIKTKVHLAGKAPRTKAAKTAPIARLDPHFLFSFSGIKTAVLRYVELHGLRAEARARVSRVLADFARQLPTAANPRRSSRALSAANIGPDRQLSARGDRRLDEEDLRRGGIARRRRILVTGGVAANRELRERFTRKPRHVACDIAFPTLALSTDNAAMIAAAAWPRLLAREFAAPDLSAAPSLTLGMIRE